MKKWQYDSQYKEFSYYEYEDPYQSYGEASDDDSDDADDSDDDDDSDDADDSTESCTILEWLQWNYSDVSEDDPRYDEILTEALEHYLYEGLVPALCQENCSVELDGCCSHGHPSPFLELGLI